MSFSSQHLIILLSITPMIQEGNCTWKLATKRRKCACVHALTYEHDYM